MSKPDRDYSEQPRGGNGKYVPTVEGTAKAAEAARLRSRGQTYASIARELGYTNAANARRAVQSAMAAIVAEPAAEVRQMQLDQLDALTQAVLDVLDRDHVTVSHGRIIRDDRTEEPILDDGPVLAAVDRLLRIMERRAKLLGLDAPSRVEVLTDDVIDRELEKLRAEHDAAADGEADGAEEAPGGEAGTGTP